MIAANQGAAWAPIRAALIACGVDRYSIDVRNVGEYRTAYPDAFPQSLRKGALRAVPTNDDWRIECDGQALGPALKRYERRVLVCSSGMVPKNTATALRLRERSALWKDISFEHVGDQWLIHVSSDHAAAAEFHGHAELGAVIRFAADHDFDWLVLDGDADHLPPESGLPRFEW